MIVEDKDKSVSRACVAKKESKHLDFKSSFDVTSAEAWCEIIKDIIAFANSGGGVIVFGVENDGSSNGCDPQPILACDLADITNRIAKYTGYQFDGIEVIDLQRDNKLHAAFLVVGVDVPIVFTKPGTYNIGDNKQKTAFGVGTIYFRHGAKSEPGNRSDLENWRNQEIARIKGEWLGNIRKVVRAPKGHTVALVPKDQIKRRANGDPMIVRISTDPKAPKFVPHNAEEFWPHRQKSLLAKINKRLPSTIRINGHDILCVNRRLDVLKSHPDFAYRPHKMASPQYSDTYIDWLIDQASKDPNFFRAAREEYKKFAGNKM